MEGDQPNFDPQQVAALQQAYVGAQQQIQQLEGQLQQAIAAAQPPMLGGHAAAPLKPPKPTHFSGSAKDRRSIDDWLFSLDTHVAALPAPPPHAQRINFVASYFTGTALKWWRLNAPTHTAPGATYPAFVDALRAAFAPHNAQLKAREQIDTLKQTASVSAYNTKFRELLLEVPNMQPAEQLHRYVAGLKPSIRQHVLITNPATLDDAMALADRIDEAAFAARGAPTPTRYQQQPRRRPWYPAPAGPVPMEIGALPTAQPRGRTRLTPQEREYLLSNNGCVYCRRLGHTLQQCRSRPPPRNTRAHPPPPPGNARRRGT